MKRVIPAFFIAFAMAISFATTTHASAAPINEDVTTFAQLQNALAEAVQNPHDPVTITIHGTVTATSTFTIPPNVTLNLGSRTDTTATLNINSISPYIVNDGALYIYGVLNHSANITNNGVAVLDVGKLKGNTKFLGANVIDFEKKYLVFYDVNGGLTTGLLGTVQPDNKTVVQTTTDQYTNWGDPVSLPTQNDPTWPGHTFEGWYYDNGVKAEATDKITDDTTLTAHWSAAIDYTITYVNVDGATNPNPTTYTVDDLPITLNDASKPGYTFLGWAEGNTIDIGTTGDLTFTAQWSDAITYNIDYKNVDGATNPNPTTYTVEKLPIELAPA
ncbi:MAG: InlB B-repeat-containing protein, partial [Propionibacteriaceae bacterium]|nr:InlB B-repeat-containing protein [Propionibacteriaceae bacterium]